MASQHINIHNSGVMSGNVTTAGDVNVMPGGTLRVAKTTIGGNLENGGTVQMNSEGGKPGNVLTVNGNYTGNNGLMTFNATLGGDNSPTDKMNVKGDTQGNTRVRVDNIGGVGAQTVNGIELIEGGYTFEAGTFSGSEGTLNTWYVQPQAQITWMGVKDSDHTRKDGTRIETEGDGNVQTRLGVKTYLNSHHQRDDGKQREFQPYIEANWINNSKVYAVKMNGQTVGHEGARNLGEVRTGVEAKVNNNLSLWGNVGVQLGDKGYSDTQGMLGVKYSW